MFLKNLFEDVQNKTAVLGWGRGMGHKGHMLLAKAVLHHAKENNAKPYFVVSRTSLVDPSTGQPWTDKPTFTKTKDDPLSPEEKLATYRKVFPQDADVFTVASADASTLDKVLAKIANEGFNKVILVVGEDQKNAMSFLQRPDKSGVPPFKAAGLDELEIISRQDTTEPSSMRNSPDYQEGPRATPMRQILLDPSKSEEEQFAVWRRDMPDNLSDEEVMDLMRKAKQRMSMVPAAKRGGKQGVAEAFGPLPRKRQQIRLGRHTVDIERVGLDKNYIGFAWHDSQGQEHYEEVAVGDLGSYDDLIKKIKQEISYQERRYTDQGVAEGDNFTGDIKHNISASVDLPKWKIGLPVFVKHLGQKGTIDSLGNDSAIVSVGMRQYRVKLNDLKRYPSKGVAEGSMKDLHIDLQDQQWDAIVGYVITGLKKNMDIGRMELNLYKYAGQEMFDVDQELQDRGFKDIADLANHIKQYNGKYVPPTDFDLGKGVAEGSASLLESVDPKVSIVFDKYNPPDKDSIDGWKVAAKNKYWLVGTNKVKKDTKNPLPHEVKLVALETAMPRVMEHLEIVDDWLHLAVKAYKKYGDIELVVCTRHDNIYKDILQKNGHEGKHGYFKFDKITRVATPYYRNDKDLKKSLIDKDKSAFKRSSGVSPDKRVVAQHNRYEYFDLLEKFMIKRVPLVSLNESKLLPIDDDTANLMENLIRRLKNK